MRELLEGCVSKEIAPRLKGASLRRVRGDGRCWQPTGAWATARRLRLTANLSDKAISTSTATRQARLIWGTELGDGAPTLVR